MALGQSGIEYEVVRGWERLPEGWAFTEVVGVAVDSRDRVYVFCRGEHPLIVFDKEGRFLDAWGEGMFRRPHGITIAAGDQLWLVDDAGHSVSRYTLDGKLEQRIGGGKPSRTGFEPGQSPVEQAAGPFNTVTNVAIDPAGRIFAADGYGNARVHRFGAAGELELSWGEPGGGPGQFNLPHGIALDSAGRVYVADRENSRVQIFSPDGEFITAWSWPNRPCDLFIDGQDTIYVAELGFQVATWQLPHLRLMRHPPPGHDPIARVTITNPDGEIVARVGGDSVLPGNFIAPHGIWVDSRGDFYVGEVTVSSDAVKNLAPFTPHCFQKFQRGR
ncbi:MAG: peptidyl-alpha-hydroxyglycine alpha-amidating lyase family protein [bacterium]